MVDARKIDDQLQVELISQLSAECPICNGKITGTPMSNSLAKWAQLVKISFLLGGHNSMGACQAIFHLGIRVGAEYANREELERLGKKEKNECK